MRHPFAGAAAQFAHLAGLGRRAPKAESDERKNDEAKGKRAEEDEKDPDAKDPDEEEEKAEEDEKDPKAEDPDEEKEKAEEDENDPDAKKAKSKGKGYSAGRADERKRCSLIFSSPHATGQAHVAARLAFSTSLSATEAIGILAETSASAGQGKRGLGERMATVPNPAVGPDGGSAPVKGSAAETIARMTSAYNRATGGAVKK